jgi:hypothetical protein
VQSSNCLECFQINGVDVTSSPHEQAVALLTSAATEVTIVVYRDSPHFEQPINENSGHSNEKVIAEPSVARMECGPVLRLPPLSVNCANGEVLGSVPINQSLSRSSPASSTSPLSTQLQTVSSNTSEPAVARKLVYNVGEMPVAEPPMPASAAQNTTIGLSGRVLVQMPRVSPVPDVRPALPTAVAPSKDGVCRPF